MSKLRVRIELDLNDELDITVRDVDESVVETLIVDTLYNLQRAKSTHPQTTITKSGVLPHGEK